MGDHNLVVGVKQIKILSFSNTWIFVKYMIKLQPLRQIHKMLLIYA